MSPYRICIVRADGGKVLLHPGRSGERDLIASVIARVMAKGVGVLRTEAHVRAALESSLHETLRDLKSDAERVVS